MALHGLPEHWCVTENPAASITLLLAPGSGSLMDSPFMETLAVALAEKVRVVRFEFPFQQWVRAQGRPRPPEPLAKLLAFYQEQVLLVLQHWPETRLWVGGKSLGGRVAVHLLADPVFVQRDSIEGALVLGYPFHPVAKPQQLRTDILVQVEKPLWIAQGERDPFGSRDEVETYGLSPEIVLNWVSDGDHDLKVRRQPESVWREKLQSLGGVAAAFMQR